jgi:hypothetical protein
MNWPKVMLNWLEEITVIWTRCLLIFDLLNYNQSLRRTSMKLKLILLIAIQALALPCARVPTVTPLD